MEHSLLLRRSNEAKRAKLETHTYLVTWRSTADVSEYSGIAGFTQVARLLGITEHSLRCYLSRGKGSVSREGVNPTTGEPDVMAVTRHVPAKPKAKRGRPPKVVDRERLGSEADHVKR